MNKMDYTTNRNLNLSDLPSLKELAILSTVNLQDHILNNERLVFS